MAAQHILGDYELGTIANLRWLNWKVRNATCFEVSLSIPLKLLPRLYIFLGRLEFPRYSLTMERQLLLQQIYNFLDGNYLVLTFLKPTLMRPQATHMRRLELFLGTTIENLWHRWQKRYPYLNRSHA